MQSTVQHLAAARLPALECENTQPLPHSPQANGTTPRVAQRANTVQIIFEIRDAHAPALRSAVEEISNTIGGRMEALRPYAREDALVRASIAVATLRAAVCALVPAADPNYRGSK